jgi:hypothetical protein
MNKKFVKRTMLFSVAGINSTSPFPHLLVFLLSVWQVNALPLLAIRGVGGAGGGGQPIPMKEKELVLPSLFVFIYECHVLNCVDKL